MKFAGRAEYLCIVFEGTVGVKVRNMTIM